jgi:hypothetical protein
MNPESCPKLYNCSKVQMTPMIRVLLRCTAAEAMQSICSSCEEAIEGGKKVKSQANRQKDYALLSPSGKKIMVVVGDRSRSQPHQKEPGS